MKKISKKLIVFIAILLVAVILAIVVTSNIMEINIANGSYNSANNNSSSANLLPEYIKEGITLGGITGTLVDLDTSDATATAEDIVWGKTAYVDGKKITGTYLTLGMLEIGDYVAYSPGSETESSYTLSMSESGYTSDQTIPKDTSLKWRVLSINDDGTVDLVSDTETDTLVYYRGATGYNNGVYSLNNICSQLYSNSSLGATARSMKIEDIEAGMNESGLNYVHTYSNVNSQADWGETYTYTSNRYYPSLYALENGSGIDLSTINDPNSAVKEDGISQSDSYYSTPNTDSPAYKRASKSLTVKQTYYSRSMSSSYYKDEQIFYDLVHTNGTAWIASRYCFVFDSSGGNDANFGLRTIGLNNLGGSDLFYSSNVIKEKKYYLRPVISLSANIRLDSGDGSSTSPYELGI